MSKIRVLVVDDAVVIRRLLTDVLESDPELEVAGVAANGVAALEKIPSLQPDIITLDVEMPEMDGIETLKAIRKNYPKLPVIMFSSLTERGAVVTLEALAMGANDYVTKPANVGSVMASTQSIRNELIPKIKVFCSGSAHKQQLSATSSVLASGDDSRRRVDIVAIAVSTGGPNALEALIPKIPADFPVPIVMVQHMPPLFTETLARRLSQLSQVSVHEASPGDLLQKGGVWLAPGGYHMTLSRKIAAVEVQTNQSPPVNSCRPSADVLFRSVAELFGRRSLAVVLTGMGEDGLKGCRMIHQAGGKIIVQDEATSVVWGMPGNVAKAGLADQVLPISEIAGEIVRRVRFGRL